MGGIPNSQYPARIGCGLLNCTESMLWELGLLLMGLESEQVPPKFEVFFYEYQCNKKKYLLERLERVLLAVAHLFFNGGRG